MEQKVNELLKLLVDEDLVEYKCFDVLKKKLLEDEDFFNTTIEGIRKGMISKFPRTLFDKVCDQNIRAKFKPVQIFIDGANIGNCTIISKMISYSLPYCDICGGTMSYLCGTKNSPDGRHTWVSYNGNIIEPTLMIQINESFKKEYGYNEENRYNPNHNLPYSMAKDFANDPNLKDRKRTTK